MHPFEGVPLSFCIPLFLEYLESTYGEAVRTIVSFCIGAVLFGLAVGIPICRNRRKQMRAQKKAEEVVEYARQSASCHRVSDAEPQPEMEQPNRAETNSEPHAATEFVTDAEILSDYIRETESETAQVEYETQNTRKKTLWQLGKFALLVLILLAVWRQFMGKLGLHAVASSFKLSPGVGPYIVVVGIILWIVLRKRKKSASELPKESVIYQKLLPRELTKRFGENCFYRKRYGFSFEEMQELTCWKQEVTHISGKDSLRGKYHQMAFQAAYETCIREYQKRDSDGDLQTYQETVFQGLVLRVPYTQYSPDALGVCANSKKELAARYEQKKPKQVVSAQISKTENETFHELFTVHSNQEENLYYFLTPSKMEQLAALYAQVYGLEEGANSNPFTSLGVCFYQGYLYLALGLRQYFLEYKRVPPTAEALHSIQEKMKADLDLIEQALRFAEFLF